MRALLLTLLALAWMGASPRLGYDTAWWWIVAPPLLGAVLVGVVAGHAWTVPGYALVVGLGGSVLCLRVDEALYNEPLTGLGYLYVIPFAALCVLAGIVGLLIRLAVGVARERRRPSPSA